MPREDVSRASSCTPVVTTCFLMLAPDVLYPMESQWVAVAHWAQGGHMLQKSPGAPGRINH